MTKLPTGASPALLEVLEKTGELDAILDGRGLQFERAIELPSAPQPVVQEFRIEPADWEAEARERREHEEQENRERHQLEYEKYAAERARIEQEAESAQSLQSRPAKARPKWRP